MGFIPHLEGLEKFIHPEPLFNMFSSFGIFHSFKNIEINGKGRKLKFVIV